MTICWFLKYKKIMNESFYFITQNQIKSPFILGLAPIPIHSTPIGSPTVPSITARVPASSASVATAVNPASLPKPLAAPVGEASGQVWVEPTIQISELSFISFLKRDELLYVFHESI